MRIKFSEKIPDIKSRERKAKPWMSNKKELEEELQKLGIRKKDLNLGSATEEKPIYLDTINNPVDRVNELKLHWHCNTLWSASKNIKSSISVNCKIHGYRNLSSST